MKSLIACTMAVLFVLAITIPLMAQAEINVNTASAFELQRIKGIGPKTAQAIIEYRNEHGPFNSVHDVTRVKGVGPKTLERMVDSGLVAHPVDAE